VDRRTSPRLHLPVSRERPQKNTPSSSFARLLAISRGLPMLNRGHDLAQATARAPGMPN
jgi:hypothetical protein